MDLVFKVGMLMVKTIKLGLPLLKELHGDLLEQGIGEDVLLLDRPRLDFLSQTVKLRRERVGRTLGDGFFGMPAT